MELVWYPADIPIIATNGVSILLDLSTIFAGLKYKVNKKGRA